MSRLWCWAKAHPGLALLFLCGDVLFCPILLLVLDKELELCAQQVPAWSHQAAQLGAWLSATCRG